MRKNQIAYHSYAFDEINSWMCQNFLQLNKEKTEVIAFGNKDEVLRWMHTLTLGVKQLKSSQKSWGDSGDRP